MSEQVDDFHNAHEADAEEQVQVSAQVAEQVDPRDFGLLGNHTIAQRVIVNSHLGNIGRQIVLKIGLVGVLAEQHRVSLEHFDVLVVGICVERLMLIDELLVALEGTLGQAVVLDEVARVEHLIVQVVGARLLFDGAEVVARYLKRQPVVAAIAHLAFWSIKKKKQL